MSHFTSLKWLHAVRDQEVGVSRSIHNSSTIYRGILLLSTGRKLRQPFLTLSVNLRNAQRLRKSIGKVRLNSSIQTFLKQFRKPFLRRDVILKLAKEVYNKASIIVQSHNLALKTLRYLAGEFPPLYALLETKFTWRLWQARLGSRLLNICKTMIRLITSLIKTVSTSTLRRSIMNANLYIPAFLEAYHSPNMRYLEKQWRNAASTYGELADLAKHIGQYTTSAHHYSFDILTTLKTYVNNTMESYLTTCPSVIGQGAPAYISSMFASLQRSTSNTAWSRSRLGCQESSQATSHSIHALTLPTTASLRSTHCNADVNDGEYANHLSMSIVTMRCDCFCNDCVYNGQE